MTNSVSKYNYNYNAMNNFIALQDSVQVMAENAATSNLADIATDILLPSAEVQNMIKKATNVGYYAADVVVGAADVVVEKVAGIWTAIKGNNSTSESNSNSIGSANSSWTSIGKTIKNGIQEIGKNTSFSNIKLDGFKTKLGLPNMADLKVEGSFTTKIDWNTRAVNFVFNNAAVVWSCDANYMGFNFTKDELGIFGSYNFCGGNANAGVNIYNGYVSSAFANVGFDSGLMISANYDKNQGGYLTAGKNNFECMFGFSSYGSAMIGARYTF